MIITNNEEALRVKCEDVLPDEAASLIATLEAELDYANKLGKGGIGLAAPQIGIAKNIAIIRLDKSRGPNFNLINCKIEKGFDPAVFKEEGCLSFPGRIEDTIRFQEIYVTNNLVYPYSFIATGLVSVVCQHEIDHLTSTLFMDRITPKITSAIKKHKVGPNDPCVCGQADPITGKIRKFKKCCGA
jgi:peptide deformylase